jgi:hypothetical protein
VLRDARTRITLRREDVDLVGLRFWTRRVEDVARVAGHRDRFSMLLAHDPRRWPAAIELGLPLVISGHTHGGQVVLPGLGAVAARKFPVPEGLGLNRRSTLFVSRGIGTVYVPVRINCPPEVSLLTLTGSRTVALDREPVGRLGDQVVVESMQVRQPRTSPEPPIGRSADPRYPVSP